MALKKWAYIYLSPKFSSKAHTTRNTSELTEFISVGLDFEDKSSVVEVSKELAREGAQLIELCGGFGPVWIAKVIEATGGKIPVGGVSYGPEARQALLDIMATKT